MTPPTAAPSRPTPIVTPVQSRGPFSEFPHAARVDEDGRGAEPDADHGGPDPAIVAASLPRPGR